MKAASIATQALAWCVALLWSACVFATGAASAADAVRADGAARAADASEASDASEAGEAPDAVHAQADWVAPFRRAVQVERDLRKALAIARAAADAGDVAALTIVAIWTRKGIGTARDPFVARDLLERAAAAGDRRALDALAEMLVAGDGGAQDLDRASALFRASAEKGYARAYLDLARLHRRSDFAERDDRKAYEFAEEAARMGYAPAFGYLGALIANGTGTQKNPQLAMTWLRRGASAGDRTSKANLGYLLVRGDGVSSSPREGERLLKDAASEGSAVAMAYLARLYRSGQALARDYERAYFYATLALANGAPARPQLAALRDELETRLPVERVAALQKQARDWRPRKVSAPARQGADADTADARDRDPANPLRVAGAGTGFFVSRDGHALTNAHVVSGCERVVARDRGDARVVFADAASDLAILKVARPAPDWARFRSGPARLAEPVYLFGYPLANILAASGNFTSGLVSSVIGYRNNPSMFQLTAPVQRGNSGGAVFDSAGGVLGVVVGQLRAETAQNANFAIHARVARRVLEANGVEPEEASGAARLEPEEIAEIARRVSVQVLCLKPRG